MDEEKALHWIDFWGTVSPVAPADWKRQVYEHLKRQGEGVDKESVEMALRIFGWEVPL
jgi:hypothetical protein